jgi:hypothetical protein
MPPSGNTPDVHPQAVVINEDTIIHGTEIKTSGGDFTVPTVAIH